MLVNKSGYFKLLTQSTQRFGLQFVCIFHLNDDVCEFTCLALWCWSRRLFPFQTYSIFWCQRCDARGLKGAYTFNHNRATVGSVKITTNRQVIELFTHVYKYL